MTVTLTPISADAPLITCGADVRLVRASASMWRVVDSGRVIGHLERVELSGARPFRARRFRVASRSFMDVGDFWSADDAVAALRAGR